MINRLMTTYCLKKQKLRNNEYYNMQDVFDDLFHKAKKNNYKFYKLMEIITSSENIKLAYRNIKRNNGSKTEGTNGRSIEYIANMKEDEFVEYIQSRFNNYTPHEVRRVEIPKPNGKTRPLGIPTVEDRIVQQCIKQVLEPICEAKFYEHSYGFRPNRSTHHAIAKCYNLMQSNKLSYVVDVDIKGFFDNVSHEKLIKQMWTLGIQDKRLLCIIGKMLKAPIKGQGIPTKGTPQGGILSPLLANIVLNELDWWIANQWEHIKTKHNYDRIRNGKIERSNKYTSLRRKSKLKEMYIVRYADDFKIFCRDSETANKSFHATKQWLKERLQLEISEEKSKIVNLKTNYSEYLGFKMKLRKKSNNLVVQSHMTNKAKEKAIKELRGQIIKIQKQPDINNVNRYNSMVLGLQNYYKVATNVNVDFSDIAYRTNIFIYNRTKRIRSSKGESTILYKKLYSNYNYKTYYIANKPLFPIRAIKTKPPMCINQNINNYTEEGRKMIHAKQNSVSNRTLKLLMENPNPAKSVEYNDNRISLYVAQKGECKVTKQYLEIDNMECHHIKPVSMGGTDEYSNLVLITYEVHKLIHATKTETINKYINIINPNKTALSKINKLRKQVGNTII